MKKLYAVLAVALLALAPLAVAETPAEAPEAPAAPLDEAPLVLDEEPNMTPLPNETPEPQPLAKNCELQDTWVTHCVNCQDHCDNWIGCYVNRCFLLSGLYWCDCTENPP